MPGRAFASTFRSDVVLGINCAFHECCASLVVDGVVVAAAEEERFNRVKHSKLPTVHNAGQLPTSAIQFCLDKHELKAEDVPVIALSFEPEDMRTKFMNHTYPYDLPDPESFGNKEFGIPTFYRSLLSAEANLRELGFVGEVRFLPHHDCHAASAFYTSGLDKAAVLVIDGIGEFDSTKAYYADNGVMTPLDCLACPFPHSLGFLWEKLCRYLGFSRYDASKVMGLASYGDPSVFQTRMDSILHIHDDGSFQVDDTILMFDSEAEDHMDKLAALFEHPARSKPVSEPTDADAQWALDLAATLQRSTETVFIRMAKTLKTKTNANYLCFSGGVALNCAANAKMLETGLFKDIFVCPAANDAGTAIGAAYLARASALQEEGQVPPTPPAMHHAYLGPSFNSDYIVKVVSSSNLAFTRYEWDVLPREAAKLVAAGDVAWFQGGMELGPCALGNWSILGDPRNNAIREILNVKIKHRELFRPFCPSVLEEEARTGSTFQKAPFRTWPSTCWEPFE